MSITVHDESYEYFSTDIQSANNIVRGNARVNDEGVVDFAISYMDGDDLCSMSIGTNLTDEDAIQEPLDTFVNRIEGEFTRMDSFILRPDGSVVGDDLAQRATTILEDEGLWRGYDHATEQQDDPESSSKLSH